MKNAIDAAVEAGYTHIDCAHLYGNEAEIGEALETHFIKGPVRREDLFIVSKVEYVGSWTLTPTS